MSKLSLAFAAALLTSLISTDASAGDDGRYSSRRYVPGGTRTVIVPALPPLYSPPPCIGCSSTYVAPTPRAHALRVSPSRGGSRYSGGRRY